MLVGDDYAAWDGVTKAADAFAVETGVPLAGKRGKFIMSKGNRRFAFTEAGGLLELA